MKRIDWEHTAEPDLVEKSRLYLLTEDATIEPTIYFDPATGIFYAEYWSKPMSVRWEASIQTFPHGDVH